MEKGCLTAEDVGRLLYETPPGELRNELKRQYYRLLYTPVCGETHDALAYTAYMGGRKAGKTFASLRVMYQLIAADYARRLDNMIVNAMTDLFCFGHSTILVKNDGSVELMPPSLLGNIDFTKQEEKVFATLDMEDKVIDKALHPKEVVSKLNGKTYPVVGTFQNDYYVIRANDGKLHIGHKETFRPVKQEKWVDVTAQVSVSPQERFPDVAGNRSDREIDTLIRNGWFIGWLNPAEVVNKGAPSGKRYRFVVKDVYTAEDLEKAWRPGGITVRRKAIFIEEDQS